MEIAQNNSKYMKGGFPEAYVLFFRNSNMTYDHDRRHIFLQLAAQICEKFEY